MCIRDSDNTEVEIGENIDYGETDLRSIIEGDRRFNQEESFGEFGYQQQELQGEELVDVEEDSSEDFDEDVDFIDLDTEASVEE